MGALSTSVFAMLLVSLVFVSFFVIVDDFEQNYVDTGYSNVSKLNESYRGNFDISGDINNSLSETYEGFRNLEDEDKGFFEALLDEAIVIPLAIISFPGVMIDVFITSLGLMNAVAEVINIPPAIFTIFAIAVVALLILALVSFWRRWNT